MSSSAPPQHTDTVCHSRQVLAGENWQLIPRRPKPSILRKAQHKAPPGLRLASWEGKLLNREECRVKAETRGSWGGDNWASEGTALRSSGLQTSSANGSSLGGGGTGGTSSRRCSHSLLLPLEQDLAPASRPGPHAGLPPTDKQVQCSRD